MPRTKQRKFLMMLCSTCIHIAPQTQTRSFSPLISILEGDRDRQFDAMQSEVNGTVCKVDHYLCDLKESLYWNRQLGVEYVTFQIWLPERYMTGDGSYRNDDSLLKEYVERVKTLQDICHDKGLNFYVETHVGKISEDQ
eukprot:1006469_1